MLWKVLIPIVVSALLGWGAWNTLATTSALPETKFEIHEKDNNDKFLEVLKEIQKQRDKIEEKLDAIQEKL
jgi:hypothetical protein